MDKVMIYTDGACKGNPGPGGWAAILEFNGVEKEIYGGKPDTTNNNMELTAVIEALHMLKRPCDITIVTDSKYVADSFMKGWYINWIKKNERKRPNYALWEELYNLSQIHAISIEWVRGHQGHHYNERCDKLAQMAANSYLK